MRPNLLVFRYQALFIACIYAEMQLTHHSLQHILFIWFFISPSRTYSLFGLWAFMLTCSIMWQARIQTLKKFFFRQPTKRIMMDLVSREHFMLEHSMYGNFLIIIREISILVSPQPPISSHINLTFPQVKTLYNYHFRRYNQPLNRV